jgi:hypothetical protein
VDLAQRGPRLGHERQAHLADGHVELRLAKRHVRRVRLHPFDGTTGGELPGDREHPRVDVEAHDAGARVGRAAATLPVPQATSSTRSPGATAARPTSASAPGAKKRGTR